MENEKFSPSMKKLEMLGTTIMNSSFKKVPKSKQTEFRLMCMKGDHICTKENKIIDRLSIIENSKDYDIRKDEDKVADLMCKYFKLERMLEKWLEDMGDILVNLNLK